MYTVTKDLLLLTTVTGSWPRPSWFDMSLWGKPIDTCMLDTGYRERFQDAVTVVIGDEQRAGLDIVTHGDLHCDDDMAGRSWHHYPLQHNAPEQLILSSDCGFGRQGCNRNIAIFKSSAIAQGANLVRRELGLPLSPVPAAEPALQTDLVPQRPDR